MNRYQTIVNRMENGECILIDGATGTEVERRGVPQLENAWNGGGALSHPDIVREVHEDYIREGAQLVISNTFATSRHALRDAGVEADFEAYNRRSVELAIEARERTGAADVLVAGGISYWSWTGRHASTDELHASVWTQAGVMADAGADLLMLEMMIDTDKMLTTLGAAQTSGLPVWVGLTCGPDDSGQMCLRNGDNLIEALAALKDRDVPLVNIMHTPAQYVDVCLDVLGQHWDGLVGVYPDSGRHENDRMAFGAEIDPDALVSYAKGWLQRDIHLIGACCGMGVEHIVALRALL